MTLPTLQDYRWYFITSSSTLDVPSFPLQPYTIRFTKKTITSEDPSNSLFVGSVILDRVFALNWIETHAGSRTIWIPSNLATRPSAPEDNTRDPMSPEPPMISMAYNDFPDYERHSALHKSILASPLNPPASLPPISFGFNTAPFQTYDSPHFFSQAQLVYLADAVQAALQTSSF